MTNDVNAFALFAVYCLVTLTPAYSWVWENCSVSRSVQLCNPTELHVMQLCRLTRWYGAVLSIWQGREARWIPALNPCCWLVDCVWNVMAHAQKPDFVFRRNGRGHLNRQGRHFSRLLAAEVCASAVVMLDTPSSEVLWRVLATHSIRQFPLHFPSLASPCAITFQLDSTAHYLFLTPLGFWLFVVNRLK